VAAGRVPELAVEIMISSRDGDGVPWEDKLTRYHELGVQELVPCRSRSGHGPGPQLLDTAGSL
jgi:hypothetical protein